MKTHAPGIAMTVFAALILIMELALLGYWYWLLEPRLRTEAASQAQVLAQAQAATLATALASDDPLQVLTGCVAATRKLMERNGITAADVELFELHEAFAATAIKCRQDLNIPNDKLNVNGGVIALGHPMGATGAIMAGTLLDELRRRGLRRGIVAASGAAGSGSALLLELL